MQYCHSMSQNTQKGFKRKKDAIYLEISALGAESSLPSKKNMIIGRLMTITD